MMDKYGNNYILLFDIFIIDRIVYATQSTETDCAQGEDHQYAA